MATTTSRKMAVIMENPPIRLGHIADMDLVYETGRFAVAGDGQLQRHQCILRGDTGGVCELAGADIARQERTAAGRRGHAVGVIPVTGEQASGADVAGGGSHYLETPGRRSKWKLRA